MAADGLGLGELQRVESGHDRAGLGLGESAVTQRLQQERVAGFEFSGEADVASDLSDRGPVAVVEAVVEFVSGGAGHRGLMDESEAGAVQFPGDGFDPVDQGEGVVAAL